MKGLPFTASAQLGLFFC